MGVQSPSPTKAKEKGFFSAQDTLQGECQQELFRIIFFFPWIFTAGQIWPRAATPSSPQAAAFPTNVHEICAVGRDHPLQCHIHPISSAFPELRWKKEGISLCFQGWEGGSVGAREMEAPKPTPKSFPVGPNRAVGITWALLPIPAKGIPTFPPGLSLPGLILVFFHVEAEAGRGRRRMRRMRMLCPCLTGSQ